MKPTTCIHYRGTQHACCNAGVRFSEVVPGHGESGWGLRLPCFTEPLFKSNPKMAEEHAKRGTCPKLQLPTQADIDAEAKWLEREKQYAALANPLLAQVKEARRSMDFACPVCSGLLRIEHREPNGHTSGICVNGCYNWIE